MDCSYKKNDINSGWSAISSDDNKQKCNMPDCCSIGNCQETCNFSSMADPFMTAVDKFSSNEFAKDCSKNSVTEIVCSNLLVKGHLFVNQRACGDLKNGLRPTKHNVISTCKCVCKCQDNCDYYDEYGTSDNSGCEYKCECQKNIYCKLKRGSLQTTTMTTTITTTTTEKVTTTVDTSTTVQKELTTPAVTTSTTKTPPHTYPTEHTTSSAVTFTKQASSASNRNGVSTAVIGGSVGGVIVFLIIAILLLIFIRRRSSRQKRTENNIQNHNGAFFNSTYNQDEVNLHSTTTGVNTDSVIVPSGHGHHQNHFGNTDDHEYANTNLPHREKEYANKQVNDRSTKSFVENSDYEFAKPEGIDDNYLELKIDSNENSYERLKSQQTDEGKSQSLSEKYADTDNYELAKPVPINNDENYFELEPQSHEDCDVKAQQNGVENYFVLEKENQSQGAGNIDDVYNTLHENLKANDDDNKDEYHHLRDITRSGKDGKNHMDDDADDDYDMLKNGAKNQDDFFNDDYDHCKPRKFPNGEDDYEHFT